MHVSLLLSSSRSALPRVLSVIHGKGWVIRHLHVEGRSACLLLDGADERIVSVLSRILDVVVVTCDNNSASACQTGSLSGVPVQQTVAV